MPKITLTKTGQEFDVPAGMSLLEFCQSNDAPHDFGCTVGSCGTCVCVLESGAENVNPRSDEERETIETCTDVEQARLGCQLTINGDVVIRQLD